MATWGTYSPTGLRRAASVIDQRVDTAETFNGRRHKMTALRLLRHVRRHHQRFRPGRVACGGHGLQGRFLARRQDQRDAFLRQLARHLFADAVGRASDDDHFHGVSFVLATME